LQFGLNDLIHTSKNIARRNCSRRAGVEYCSPEILDFAASLEMSFRNTGTNKGKQESTKRSYLIKQAVKAATDQAKAVALKYQDKSASEAALKGIGCCY
jgi:hypothetical protein